MDAKKAVYRVYGGDDILLYVGSTCDPLKRLLAHCNKSPWAKQITKIVISEMMSEHEASRVEGEAIDNELPKHNKYGRKAYRGPSYKPTGAMQAAIELARKRGELALHLKAANRTWAQVGAMMGITRQRAQQLGAKVLK